MALIPHSAATACMQTEGQKGCASCLCQALFPLFRVSSAGQAALLAACVLMHCYPIARWLTARQATPPYVHLLVPVASFCIYSHLKMPVPASRSQC